MEILTTPNPLLRKVASPVTVWDKKAQREVNSMIKLLKSAKDPEGVGLAATQIGIDKRIFVIDFGDKVEVFINPKIISTSKEMLSDKFPNPKKRYLEGCLSVPHLWGFVDRPLTVTFQYQLPTTLKTVSATFSGEESSYTQHELDHLNGILFTDRILEQGGTILRETKQGLEPVTP